MFGHAVYSFTRIGLACLALMCAMTLSSGHVHASQPNGLKIVLIPGVVMQCLSRAAHDVLGEACDDDGPYIAENRARDTFADLRAALGASSMEFGDDDFHYFNYAVTDDGAPDTGRTWYFGRETRAGIHGSARALGAQLRSWKEADPPGTRYDIVTHSLGGAVATYWAGSIESDPDLLAAVHAIITLDGPVQGTPGLIPSVGLWQDVAGESGQEIQVQAYKDAMRASTENIDVFSLGNASDFLVPPDGAVFSRGFDPQLCPILSGCVFDVPAYDNDGGNHGAILRDPRMHEVVQRLVEVNGTFWLRRNFWTPSVDVPSIHDGVASTEDPVQFFWNVECRPLPSFGSCAIPDRFQFQLGESGSFAAPVTDQSYIAAPRDYGGTWQAPSSLGPGHWSFRVRAFWGDHVVSEWSNTFAFTRPTGVHLVLATLIATQPDFPHTGDQVRFGYAIRNLGDRPFEASEVYLDGSGPDGYWKAWACGGPNGQPPCGAIQAGERANFTSVLLRVGTPGIWSIEQQIVYDRSGAFQRLGTDLGIFTVYPGRAADPRLVSGVTVSPSPATTGDRVTFSYDVSNEGDAGLGLTEVYVDGDGPDGYWKAWACGGPNGQPPCAILGGHQTRHFNSVIASVGSAGTWHVSQQVVYYSGGPYRVLGANLASLTVQPGNASLRGALSTDELALFLPMTTGDSTGGRVVKWRQPLHLQVLDGANSDRLTALDRVISDLRTLLPVSIDRVSGGGNVFVRFVPQTQVLSSIGATSEGGAAVGAATLRWDSGGMQGCQAAISTDQNPAQRARIIQHELGHCLGFSHSTQHDSVMYCECTLSASTPEAPYAARDRKFIQVLYDARVRVGMTRDQLLGLFR
jgi:hypothetical protein